jgi:hypothetical protein
MPPGTAVKITVLRDGSERIFPVASWHAVQVTN